MCMQAIHVWMHPHTHTEWSSVAHIHIYTCLPLCHRQITTNEHHTHFPTLALAVAFLLTIHTVLNQVNATTVLSLEYRHIQLVRLLEGYSLFDINVASLHVCFYEFCPFLQSCRGIVMTIDLLYKKKKSAVFKSFFNLTRIVPLRLKVSFSRESWPR